MSSEKKVTAASLHPSHFKSAEYTRNVFVAVAAIGTKREDMLRLDYWAHVALKLKPWDTIDVRAEDSSFLGTYVVRNADRTWARVHEMSFTLFEAQKMKPEEVEAIREQYDVKMRGPKGWTVIRKNGNAVIHEGEHSKEDAEAWLSKFLSSQSITVAA